MNRILPNTPGRIIHIRDGKLLKMARMSRIETTRMKKIKSMEYTEIIEEAARTLTINKLRTGLAMLGIIIGIGSVIALVSLGQGSQAAVSNQIESLGANILTISPGSQRSGFVQGGAGSATTLTLEDAQAISTSPTVTDVANVSPEYSRRAQVTALGKIQTRQLRV
jgi:putative ABC transport system permease protein